jgi:outer membrane lipopolysaccharide assembly protein LptE/RlpB
MSSLQKTSTLTRANKRELENAKLDLLDAVVKISNLHRKKRRTAKHKATLQSFEKGILRTAFALEKLSL